MPSGGRSAVIVHGRVQRAIANQVAADQSATAAKAREAECPCNRGVAHMPRPAARVRSGRRRRGGSRRSNGLDVLSVNRKTPRPEPSRRDAPTTAAAGTLKPPGGHPAAEHHTPPTAERAFVPPRRRPCDTPAASACKLGHVQHREVVGHEAGDQAGERQPAQQEQPAAPGAPATPAVRPSARRFYQRQAARISAAQRSTKEGDNSGIKERIHARSSAGIEAGRGTGFGGSAACSSRRAWQHFPGDKNAVSRRPGRRRFAILNR